MKRKIPGLLKMVTLIVLLCQVMLTNLALADNSIVQKTKTVDEVYLNLQLDNMSIEKALVILQEKTKFNFTYDAKDLDPKVKLNFKGNNVSLKEVLLQISKESSLSFRQINNNIDVKKISKKNNVNDAERIKIYEAAITVKGRVISQEDNEGLPGVNVVIKNTLQGAVTDINGNYSIDVPDQNSILVFSAVGFVTQEVVVGTRSVINISLVPDVMSLKEVVVVGYGVQKKETVVGAVTQMDNKTLVRSGVQDVTNAISGELSGVLTIQNTGEPGDRKAEIIIRGLSSWNGSEPLVLVDGVERDFSLMDPQEIETISVLKDASATAVFGAKGANGVIIVTTRRGKTGKPKMEFSSSYGFEKAARIPDHIDSYTTLRALNTAYMNGGQFSQLFTDEVLAEYQNPSSPYNALRYPNVDWFKLLSKWAAPTANANLNISGGTDFVKYFASMSYLHAGDFFKGYDDGKYHNTHYSYDKFNLRINTDFNISKSTILSFNIGGEMDTKNEPGNEMWRNLYATSPARFPAYFPAWMLEEYPDLDYPEQRGVRLSQAFGEYTGNPYSTAYDGNFNRDNGTTLFTDLGLSQDLSSLIDGLSVKGKVSLNTYSKIRALTASYGFPNYKFNFEDADNNKLIQQHIAAGTYDPAIHGQIKNPWLRNGQGNEVFVQNPLDINVGGLEGGYYKDLYYELSLNYEKSFGKHSVSGLALFNRQNYRDAVEFPRYNEGYVGRTTYNYDHKYLLELNIAYTGSEQFAPANRYGLFPSAAIGWTISEENFFKDAFPIFSFFKIRYSDGLVGSDKGARWLYESSFEKDGRLRIKEGKGANETAQWEEARKRDLGVEFGLFNDVLNVNVDFFHEKRDKMLLTPNSVTMLVGQTFKELNLGELKKHGVEVELEYNKTTASNFNYYVKGIFGYNDNRIIFKDDPVNAPEYIREAGKPLGAQRDGVLVTGNGYYQTVDDINNYVSPISKEKLVMGDYKFLDYNSDGVVSHLDKYPIEGSLYPPITFSLTPGFTYKNFSFNMMFQGNYGKFVEFNMTFENEFLKGDWRIHQSQLNYWNPYNQNVNHSTLHYSGSSSADILFWGGGEADRGYDIMIKDRFWRDASYVRIKKIYADYTFKSNALSKIMGVDGLNIYASANNVYTFTKLLEGDPERKDFNQGFYPQMAQYNIGLKLSF